MNRSAASVDRDMVDASGNQGSASQTSRSCPSSFPLRYRGICSLVRTTGIMLGGLAVALWFAMQTPRDPLYEPTTPTALDSWAPGGLTTHPAAPGLFLRGPRGEGSKRETGAGPHPSSDTVNKVDVNRSTAEELQRLPGIGPILAQRIIQRRDHVGPFERLDDLLTVHGIGRARLAGLAAHVRVEPSARSSRVGIEQERLR